MQNTDTEALLDSFRADEEESSFKGTLKRYTKVIVAIGLVLCMIGVFYSRSLQSKTNFNSIQEQIESLSSEFEDCYRMKYVNKWPNCNKPTFCFTDWSLEKASVECSKEVGCTGFSFTSGKLVGSGCFKSQPACSASGFGHGNHDYYERICDNSGCYKLEFPKKWPHCENIECFDDWSVDEAGVHCSQHLNCIGFSFTNGATHGNGCLKKNVGCNTNGWGEETNGYYRRLDDCLCYDLVYTNKAPHCSNINCFVGLSVKEADLQCSLDKDCLGFSFTADETRGDGCLKKEHNCHYAGFEHDEVGYYQARDNCCVV